MQFTLDSVILAEQCLKTKFGDYKIQRTPVLKTVNEIIDFKYDGLTEINKDIFYFGIITYSNLSDTELLRIRDKDNYQILKVLPDGQAMVLFHKLSAGGTPAGQFMGYELKILGL